MEPIVDSETNKVKPRSSFNIIIMIMMAIASVTLVYLVCVVYNLNQFLTFMAACSSISIILVLRSSSTYKSSAYANVAYFIPVATLYFYVCNMNNFGSRAYNEELKFLPDIGGLMLFIFFVIMSFTIFLWGKKINPQKKVSRAYIISGLLVLISICSLIIERIDCAGSCGSGSFMCFCGLIEAMVCMISGLAAIIIAFFYTIGLSARWKTPIIIPIIILELIVSVVLVINA
jgi:hypothetical protein